MLWLQDWWGLVYGVGESEPQLLAQVLDHVFGPSVGVLQGVEPLQLGLASAVKGL